MAGSNGRRVTPAGPKKLKGTFSSSPTCAGLTGLNDALGPTGMDACRSLYASKTYFADRVHCRSAGDELDLCFGANRLDRCGRFADEISQLPEEDLQTFLSMAMGWFDVYEHAFFSYERGVLSEERLQVWKAGLCTFLPTFFATFDQYLYQGNYLDSLVAAVRFLANGQAVAVINFLPDAAPPWRAASAKTCAN